MGRRERSMILVGLLVPLVGAAAPASAAGRDVTEHACPVSSVGPAPFDDADPSETVFAFEIACLAEVGVIEGRGRPGSGEPYVVQPDALLTRGQAVSLLYRAAYAGLEPPVVPAADFFQDDNGSVHEDAINWAASADVAAGYSDGTFRPGALVTRAQAAAFVARMHDARGYALPAGEDAFADDATSVHEPAINSLAAVGVVAGTGASSYSPERSVTRGQASALLARITDLQLAEGRTGWPLPANQLLLVDPPGELRSDTDRADSSLTLTARGLTPGATYAVTLATPDDVDGNPPALGPVRFSDADGDGTADLRPVEAFLVEVNGQPPSGGNTTEAAADEDGTVTVVVDNDNANPGVVVVHETGDGAAGLQVGADGTAAQPFGVSGDLVWYARATPADR